MQDYSENVDDELKALKKELTAAKKKTRKQS